MGLLNIGRQEGAQIIQLFGRRRALARQGHEPQAKRRAARRPPPACRPPGDAERVRGASELHGPVPKLLGAGGRGNHRQRRAAAADPAERGLPGAGPGSAARPARQKLRRRGRHPPAGAKSRFMPHWTCRPKWRCWKAASAACRSARGGTGATGPSRQRVSICSTGSRSTWKLLDYKVRRGWANLALLPSTPREILATTEPARLYSLVAADAVFEAAVLSRCSASARGRRRLAPAAVPGSLLPLPRGALECRAHGVRRDRCHGADFRDYVLVAARNEAALIDDLQHLVEVGAGASRCPGAMT